ncbi:MAG: ATP-binding protein [Deltaproteobacteria bacterium]|nr:ATP-binding protein [Deltaproteobacteria bacterium]
MTSTQRLSRLFDALRLEDLSLARRIAEEIAADTERQGKNEAARVLRTALRASGHVLVMPEAAPPEALARVALDRRLDELELTAGLSATLGELVLEARHAAALADLGIQRRTRVLFSGPPGCGKSVTARALAGALGLPAFVVRIDAILGSLLGQTSTRLAAIFRFMERTPGVLIIDELDALARTRGERLDIAELDRVVVGLMQELDYARLPGLVVATTNFPEAVDPALARRFDVRLEFPRPDADQLAAFVAKRGLALGLTQTDSRRLARSRDRALEEASYADAERLVTDHARALALRRLESGSPVADPTPAAPTTRRRSRSG